MSHVIPLSDVAYNTTYNSPYGSRAPVQLFIVAEEISFSFYGLYRSLCVAFTATVKDLRFQ